LVIRENGPVPGVDYQVGDYIRERVSLGLGSTAVSNSERYRVRSIVVDVDDDGSIGTASLTLNDKFLEEEIKLARKVSGITGGANGTGGLPSTTPDVIITTPVAPATPLLSTLAYMESSGTIRSIIVADWVAPTLNTDGSPFTDLQGYEVGYKDASTSLWRTLQVTDDVVTLSNLDPLTFYEVRVKAIGKVNRSVWSSPLATILTETDTVPPSIPSKPTTTVKLGVATITWDGLTSAGNNMLDTNPDFLQVNLHRSTVNNFTPSSSTYLESLPASGYVIDSKMDYDIGYYYRFVAVDRTGNVSDPSPQSDPTIATRLVSGDLSVGVAGSKITVGATAPASPTLNDQWIDTANGNVIKIWDGDSWEPYRDTGIDLAIKGYVTEYSVNSSETVAPTTGWSTATPTRTPGTFIWFRTTVTYGDNTTSTTNPALLTGNTGAAGTPAASIDLTATTQVLTVPATGGATTPTTSVVTGTTVNTTITAWTYSVNGAAFSTTVPTGVSRTGNVVTITGSTMTAKTIAVKMADAAGLSDTLTVAKVADGAAGATGTAYTVLLTNEAHTFAGSISAALAGSAATSVIAYKGSTLFAATIGTITGQVTGLTTAITNNGTTNATVTITVTTSLVTQSGTLTIPVTVDGQTFTKRFSWSVSYKGTTGDPGSTGISVTSVTPYFQTTTSGAAAPALPTLSPPGGSWTTTEPSYTANTDLWRTERIIYSNATFAYTAVTKVSAFTAASIAMTTANGKNKVIWSTSAASGTTGYVAGDTWFRTDGSGVVIAQWEFTTSWQSRTLGNLVIAAIDAGKITTGSLDANRITALSITATHIAAGAIIADKIAANAVTADKIAANAVTADKINAGAVTAVKISAEAITAEKIAAGAITATKLSADAIDGKTITGATLQTSSSGTRVVVNGSLNLIEFYRTGATGLMGTIGAGTDDGTEIWSDVFDTGEVYLSQPVWRQSRISVSGKNGLIMQNRQYYGSDILRRAAFIEMKNTQDIKISSGSGAFLELLYDSDPSLGFDTRLYGSKLYLESSLGTFPSSSGIHLNGRVYAYGISGNTTTSAANVWINSTTSLMLRSTSLRKYKLQRQQMRNAEAIYDLRPITWIDKREHDEGTITGRNMASKVSQHSTRRASSKALRTTALPPLSFPPCKTYASESSH
ncbi:MAG: fibronectin type III domain-containing protein, partial [Actinobacteria bacterium]|nr:fibronectin type III domain-containing protein [Actinomycetota bacterium]